MYKHYITRCHSLYSEVVHKLLAVCLILKFNISGLVAANDLLFGEWYKTTIVEFLENFNCLFKSKKKFSCHYVIISHSRLARASLECEMIT